VVRRIGSLSSEYGGRPCKSQGLETPTPFLQVGNTVYKGSHETLLGSELLFKDGEGTATLLADLANHFTRHLNRQIPTALLERR
jgi:TFIIIC subunit triple barrel domain